MKDELLRFQTERTSFVFLEQSLHRVPQKMRPIIEEEIDRADHQDWDYILLGYGLCSNGILGLRAQRHPIVIPRVHDCISFFLGSPERYLEEHKKEPGTYYLTRGWIEEGKSPLGIYEEYCERQGEEIAQWAIKEEFKNYTRMVLVDTGLNICDAHRKHARENARFLGLRYEEMKGSLEFFEKMVQGSWGRQFIILKPGQEVVQELFLGNPACFEAASCP